MSRALCRFVTKHPSFTVTGAGRAQRPAPTTRPQREIERQRRRMLVTKRPLSPCRGGPPWPPCLRPHRSWLLATDRSSPNINGRAGTNEGQARGPAPTWSRRTFATQHPAVLALGTPVPASCRGGSPWPPCHRPNRWWLLAAGRPSPNINGCAGTDAGQARGPAPTTGPRRTIVSEHRRLLVADRSSSPCRGGSPWPPCVRRDGWWSLAMDCPPSGILHPRT